MMGNVERFGLLALFILCALIVGVGIFGSDGTSVPRFERAPTVNKSANAQPVPRDERGRSDGWDRGAVKSDADRIADASMGGAGDGLRPVERERRRAVIDDAPDENRTESFEMTPLDVEVRSEGGETRKPKNDVVMAGETFEYRVKSGDSLWKLAQRHLGSPSKANIARIRSANPSLGKTLQRGAMIRIPGRSSTKRAAKAPSRTKRQTGMKSYTVRSGESYWVIARDQMGGATPQNIERLRKANPQVKKDRVGKGQKINLPVLSSR